MRLFAPVAATTAALAALALPLSASEGRPKVVAYVPNWIDLDAFTPTIDFAKLTHINIAFENPVDDDGTLSFNPKNTTLISAARERGVKVLVSIGGGAASGDEVLKARYFALLADDRRAAFAKTLADYVGRHGFDGLDVDIEGPSINDDYGAFIDTLAGELNPIGKLLTAALSKGYGGNRVPDSVFARFDFLNIMAYDGAGYWPPDAPGQHSSLAFAIANVDYWVGRGLPPSKAILGVPFYGYGFGEAFRRRDYPYSQIIDDYPGAEEDDEIGNTIYYNGIPTIRAKTELVVGRGLGGVMIWSLDSDGTGAHSLLSTIDAVLTAKPVTE